MLVETTMIQEIKQIIQQARENKVRAVDFRTRTAGVGACGLWCVFNQNPS